MLSADAGFRLAVSLLQIEYVLNDIYARTACIAAFILSAGGLGLAGLLLSAIPRLRCRQGQKLWTAVSIISMVSTSTLEMLNAA